VPSAWPRWPGGRHAERCLLLSEDLHCRGNMVRSARASCHRCAGDSFHSGGSVSIGASTSREFESCNSVRVRLPTGQAAFFFSDANRPSSETARVRCLPPGPRPSYNRDLHCLHEGNDSLPVSQRGSSMKRTLFLFLAPFALGCGGAVCSAARNRIPSTSPALPLEVQPTDPGTDEDRQSLPADRSHGPRRSRILRWQAPSS